MANELQTAFNEIAELRALPEEVVLEALQSALVSAYRKDTGASSAQAIEARIDSRTGRARIFVEKEVTDEIFSENTEVTLETARFYEPEAQLGDTVMVQVEYSMKKFGRIAAQTAKQVILQKIREAERNALYDEFISREGDLMSGTVQSLNSSMVTLSLGRAEAILPRAQQIPGERYSQHERLRVLVLEVKRANRGPQIICSRSHRSMLRRLLEYEVPEIYNGQVEIKSIAREAGHRSKVAVVALQDGIDPVGACVGMRGIRIQNIVKELHDEKIDVIEWNPDPEQFISKALSPARVAGVYLDDDIYEGRTAVVVVPEDQLSLAIGREGQNARLAAKLTGWRIDIKSVTETVVGALENLDLPPLSDLVLSHANLIADVQMIVAKREQNKAIMPEEYNLLTKFANLVESHLLAQRDEMRREQREQNEAVKSTIPEELFELPTSLLELPDELLAAIAPLENIGEVMLSTLVDERRFERLFRNLDSSSAMTEVQATLDNLMSSGIDFAQMLTDYQVAAGLIDVPNEVAGEVEEETVIDEIAEEEAVEDELVEEVVEDEFIEDDEEEEVLLDAFGATPLETASPVVEEEVETEEEVDTETLLAQYDQYEAYDFAEDDVDEFDSQTKKKTSRQKRRQLVFDEETGEVRSKRRRKGNRKRSEWDDMDY